MLIGHISDLHFTTLFRENNYTAIKLALEYLIEQKVDHIVITGDLTDNAVTEDLIILRELFQKLNILYGEKLSLVIGNHDIYGGVQVAEDIFLFPERCKKIDYQKMIYLFYNCFRETFSNCFYLSDNIFPYAKQVNDTLFIGLNSIARYSSLNNPFAANGFIDSEQYNSIFKILNDDNLPEVENRIILIHHHFNKVDSAEKYNAIYRNIEKQTMKLRKKKKLLMLFKSYNIDLVLHGHYHKNEEYTRKGTRFLNAGAAFDTVNSKTATINFIDTATKPFNVDIKTLPFEYEKFENDGLQMLLTGS